MLPPGPRQRQGCALDLGVVAALRQRSINARALPIAPFGSMPSAAHAISSSVNAGSSLRCVLLIFCKTLFLLALDGSLPSPDCANVVE